MSTQTSVPPPTAATPQRRTLGRILIESPQAGVIAACVLVVLAIGVNAPTYTSIGNLQVMGRDLSQVGILAIGESLVILTGGIDLSVGALAGLAGIIARPSSAASRCSAVRAGSSASRRARSCSRSSATACSR